VETIPLGKGWSLERAKKLIDESGANILAMVYNETSTGVLNDAKSICSYAKGKGMLTTMTHTSKKILESIYAIPAEQITVIPHGIHPTLFAPSIQSKKILGLPTDKTIISTFGLLSRGKGIEYVIEALPEVIKQYPHILYLIIGATHPVIIQEEGEAYRDSLQQRITELGLNENIRFINSYVKTSQLLTYLSATDIYLATPLDPNQAVSGTLSYAMGAGRPVISTAFAQAKEDVTSESGILVDFRNSKQISQALISLLSSPERQNSLGKIIQPKNRLLPQLQFFQT
jgi:glycosyltransferase involved in cell wall biosynthesis